MIMAATTPLDLDALDVSLLLGLCWHARRLGIVEPEERALLDAVERKLEDAENTLFDIAESAPTGGAK